MERSFFKSCDLIMVDAGSPDGVLLSWENMALHLWAIMLSGTGLIAHRHGFKGSLADAGSSAQVRKAFPLDQLERLLDVAGTRSAI